MLQRNNDIWCWPMSPRIMGTGGKARSIWGEWNTLSNEWSKTVERFVNLSFKILVQCPLSYKKQICLHFTISKIYFLTYYIYTDKTTKVHSIFLVEALYSIWWKKWNITGPCANLVTKFYAIYVIILSSSKSCKMLQTSKVHQSVIMTCISEKSVAWLYWWQLWDL